MLPSTSLSLDKTLPVIGVSSGDEILSFTASGASLTAVTVMVNVSVSVPPLASLTV